ncbi:MAG TPA: WhiB family transcriptional regulator [Candidatus Saccharimonadales bacterium]|nr:WhiB family transcriptional regulator [Candidatus Saccharimonadales bacterium]
MRELRRSAIRWQNYAACDKDNAEVFFPIGNTGPALRQIEAAKSFCRSSCPAIGYCALYAIESRVDGVWGGLSEDDRQSRNIRRRPESVAMELDEMARRQNPELFTDSFLPPLPPLFISIEIPDPDATANSNIGNRA